MSAYLLKSTGLGLGFRRGSRDLRSREPLERLAPPVLDLAEDSWIVVREEGRWERYVEMYKSRDVAGSVQVGVATRGAAAAVLCSRVLGAAAHAREAAPAVQDGDDAVQTVTVSA